jgi:hypothetical protein
VSGLLAGRRSEESPQSLNKWRWPLEVEDRSEEQGKLRMREINESDWKVLRQVHTQALERFCKQVLFEIQRINSDKAKSFHQKYMDIWQVLRKRDQEIAETFDNLRRSKAFTQLASMKAGGPVGKMSS